MLSDVVSFGDPLNPFFQPKFLKNVYCLGVVQDNYQLAHLCCKFLLGHKALIFIWLESLPEWVLLRSSNCLLALLIFNYSEIPNSQVVPHWLEDSVTMFVLSIFNCRHRCSILESYISVICWNLTSDALPPHQLMMNIPFCGEQGNSHLMEHSNFLMLYFQVAYRLFVSIAASLFLNVSCCHSYIEFRTC